MSKRSPLNLIPLSSSIASPAGGSWRVALRDPALSVMTDFSDRNMVSVNAELQVDAALAVMKHAGVRSAFVVDDARTRVLGIITAYDIMGEKPLRYLQETGGTHLTSARADVHVKDIMQRAEDLLVARIEDIERAEVACILEALRLGRRSHLAVVELDLDGEPRLRGIFSREKLLRLTEASRRPADTASVSAGAAFLI